MNARQNPFVSSRVETIPFVFPADDDWEMLLARLCALGWRASIIGPHGTGKTTLLEQLAPRVSVLGFSPRLFTLRSASLGHEKQDLVKAVRLLGARDFVLLDGAEQLLLHQWITLKMATRKCGGFVITQHRTGRLRSFLRHVRQRHCSASWPRNSMARFSTSTNPVRSCPVTV